MVRRHAIVVSVLGLALASCPKAPPPFVPVDGGAGAPCQTNADCDDGIFCDGQETCVNNTCVRGSTPDCESLQSFKTTCASPTCGPISAPSTHCMVNPGNSGLKPVGPFSESDQCSHWCPDSDCDGFVDQNCSDGPCKAMATDCDDTNPYVWPGAPELCDGHANDCTGKTPQPWSDHPALTEDGGALTCAFSAYSRQITVTNSAMQAWAASTTPPFPGVPIPVDLTDTTGADIHTLIGEKHVQPDCGDVRFVSGDGTTALPYFTEVCDPDTQVEPGNFVAHWRFEQCVGVGPDAGASGSCSLGGTPLDQCNDATTHAQNGTVCQAGGPVSSDGAGVPHGKALNFGGGAYMIVPDSSTASGAGCPVVPPTSTTSLDPVDLTLSYWVSWRGANTSSAGAADAIVDKSDPATGVTSYAMGAANASCPGVPQGELLFRMDGIPATPKAVCGAWSDAGIALPRNVWTHIALTYDGSRIRVYQDGQLANVFESSLGATSCVQPTWTKPLLWGAQDVGGATGAGNFLVGEIDDARLYGTALREDEIREVARDGARFWVALPALASAAATSFYMAYGLPAGTTTPRMSHSSFDAVFNKDYDFGACSNGPLASWHFDDTSAHCTQKQLEMRTCCGTSATNSAPCSSGMYSAALSPGACWNLMDGGDWSGDTSLSFVTGSSVFISNTTGTAYITLASAASDVMALEQTGALTLEAWVNPQSLPNPGMAAVLATGDSGSGSSPASNTGYWLGFDNAHAELDLLLNTGSTPTTLTVQTPEIYSQVTRWIHLVATWDGTTAKLYVDGNLRKTASPSTPGTLVYNSALGVYLGANYNGSTFTQLFTGSVDEVKIYARAISAAEVVAHDERRVNAIPVSEVLPPPPSAVQIYGEGSVPP